MRYLYDYYQHYPLYAVSLRLLDDLYLLASSGLEQNEAGQRNGIPWRRSLRSMRFQTDSKALPHYVPTTCVTVMLEPKKTVLAVMRRISCRTVQKVSDSPKLSWNKTKSAHLEDAGQSQDESTTCTCGSPWIRHGMNVQFRTEEAD